MSIAMPDVRCLLKTLFSALIVNIVDKKFQHITVKLQWLEHLWNHENMSETGIVRANEC